MNDDTVHSAVARPTGLIGRDDETKRITALLDAAQQGRGNALVLRGPVGIGKSALLDWARDAAARRDQDGEVGRIRVIHVRGVESEFELPYAALHMLFGGMIRQMDALPTPQSQALRAALGIPGVGEHSDVSAKSRFLVGLAVLTLLSDIAEHQPLLCVVDDAHWLDEASAAALQFAARRIDAEGIFMLFALRDQEHARLDSDLPALSVAGLPRDDAHALLTSVAPGLAPTTRDRVVEASGGNPLALVELSAVLASQAQDPAADADIVLAPGPPSERIERTFGARVDALPESARSVLLIAAAADIADLSVLSAAAKAQGTALADLEPAERAGLIDVSGDVVMFRHPLIRRVVYRQAPLARRLETHLALARVLDEEEYADRRAWHMAAATPGTDDQVMTALEEAAERAQARGAYASGATAYERAASFAASDQARGRLLTASAHAMLAAGRLDAAEALIARALPLASGPVAIAEAVVVRSHVEFARLSTSIACRSLLNAAAPLVLSHPRLAEEILTAVCRALTFAPDQVIIKLADPMIEALVASLGPDRSVNLVAFWQASRLSAGHLTEAAPLARSLERAAERPAEANTLTSELTTIALLLLVSYEREALSRSLELLATARNRGMVGVLPEVLHRVASARLALGASRQSRADAVEGLAAAEATGNTPAVTRHREILAMHAALAGDERECRELADQCMVSANSHDEPHYTAQALCLLDMGLGRYESALAHAELSSGRFHGLLYLRLAPDSVEAAMRLGRRDRAAKPLADYLRWASAMADNSAVTAIAYRCRALTAGDDDAQALWTAALHLHAEDERPFEHARTLLLYGEWLRRSRRRADARDHLRNALERFERLGAHPWADRARIALRASGVTTSRVGQDNVAANKLTAQELNVARLAVQGLADREIAARLFLSPRTVSYHLSNAYRKSGISSRLALAQLLTRRDGPEDTTGAE